MICLDLDGTLLRSDKSIDINTANILNKLSYEGVEIVIATGRHYDFAKLLTRGLTDNRIIIANNGAAIYDAYLEKALFTEYIDIDIVSGIIETGKTKDMNALVYIDALREGSDLLVVEDHDISQFENTIVRDLNRVGYFCDPFQVASVLSVVFTDYIEKLEILEEKINYFFPNQITTHIMSSKKSTHGILEAMKHGVCKWSAIERLARYKNINLNEIIAFGDEVNDITMLKNSGLGIAMKNAQPEAISSADRITMYSNDNEGIFHELSNIFPNWEAL